METHAHEQVHWQAPRASVATTEVLQAGALAAIAAGFIVGHGILGTTGLQRAAGEARAPRTLRRHSL